MDAYDSRHPSAARFNELGNLSRNYPRARAGGSGHICEFFARVLLFIFDSGIAKQFKRYQHQGRLRSGPDETKDQSSESIYLSQAAAPRRGAAPAEVGIGVRGHDNSPDTQGQLAWREGGGGRLPPWDARWGASKLLRLVLVLEKWIREKNGRWRNESGGDGGRFIFIWCRSRKRVVGDLSSQVS